MGEHEDKTPQIPQLKGILRKEGDRSYKSSAFGYETFAKPTRTRRTRTQRETTAISIRAKGKALKRSLIPTHDSKESEFLIQIPTLQIQMIACQTPI